MWSIIYNNCKNFLETNTRITDLYSGAFLDYEDLKTKLMSATTLIVFLLIVIFIQTSNVLTLTSTLIGLMAWGYHYVLKNDATSNEKQQEIIID